jgi:hypothetical protein
MMAYFMRGPIRFHERPRLFADSSSSSLCTVERRRRPRARAHPYETPRDDEESLKVLYERELLIEHGFLPELPDMARLPPPLPPPQAAFEADLSPSVSESWEYSEEIDDVFSLVRSTSNTR